MGTGRWMSRGRSVGDRGWIWDAETRPVVIFSRSFQVPLFVSFSLPPDFSSLLIKSRTDETDEAGVAGERPPVGDVVVAIFAAAVSTLSSL